MLGRKKERWKEKGPVEEKESVIPSDDIERNLQKKRGKVNGRRGKKRGKLWRTVGNDQRKIAEDLFDKKSQGARLRRVKRGAWNEKGGRGLEGMADSAKSVLSRTLGVMTHAESFWPVLDLSQDAEGRRQVPFNPRAALHAVRLS